MEPILSRLSKLTPVTYKYRSEEFPNKGFGTNTQTGLIAQDVEKLFPELVSQDKDGYRQIAFQYLPFYLLQGIKEQQQQIDKLTVSNNDTITQAPVDAQLSLASSHLDTLTQQQTLQTTTLESLKKSQDAQAAIIQDIQNQIIKATPFIQTAQTQFTDMQTQVATLMDFYSQFQLGSIVSKDAHGDVDLLTGKLRAAQITTEGIAIDASSTDAPTIGTATLYPVAEDKDNDGKDDFTKLSMDDKDVKERDGKSVVVKTEALSKNHKIFAAANTKDPVAWSIADRNDGKSFTIVIGNEAKEPMSLDWWIVEQK